MQTNALFAERFQVVPAGPLDLATTGGLSSASVSLKNAKRATLLFVKAAGTAGDDPTITFTQGDGINAGNLTNGKALAAVTRADTKRHASALPATYTTEAQAAAATFTSATLAEELGCVLIDITPEMLDVDNGFNAVRATIADVGANAQLGALIWILEMAYAPNVSAQA